MCPQSEIPIDPNVAKELLYVCQRHDASSLHWDFRLEKNGVLKSWAVPKEPPTASGPRRLAIQVDDHDIQYGAFEGTIPEGSYGAGTVEIWDRGTYDVVEWTDDKIVVDVKGQKLQGIYYLLRTNPETEPTHWLFFKKKID